MCTRLTLATVVGLLFCTLATMELPELINLVDDTSNDFSTVVFVRNAVTAVKTQILRKGRRVLANVRPPQSAASLPACSLIQTFQTSDVMLHMLCVQRT